MDGVRAVLLDVDGVLAVSWQALPGASEALERLRAAGFGVRMVTNTTVGTRALVADNLRAAGFAVAPEDILTAPTATAAYLRETYPGARCALLSEGDVREDLDGVTLVDDDPEVVVLGGAGPAFDYETLNRAFRWLRDGARLVAMQRGLYWRTSEGLRLDVGAFLPGLEAASGVRAEVVGKPARAFFTAALRAVGAEPGEAVMVGDDVETDVLAAQALGLTGVLVRTGKYLPETHRAASGTPDHVVDSVADVPDLLGTPAP
ncbi:TIGR01458 family HAD-type hydrolase [Yinghuangia seranimata]|uniref:TIGR01458 family HAD-type hydrolase n=1 Tax=Yinghuangia seranimata TaxID=408067 RepID=UPI00248BE9B9|nr:TIGR01458 family HAD-type hydrolase [Yinghuangia seranimata]MDI2124703.1 TIGR01458 family HAD-type hydrolase [Yinghuangia seranimata]